MLDFITNLNNAVNNIVWGWPALILLAFVGVMMTFLTKFFQLTHIKHWFQMTLGAMFKDKHVLGHTQDRSISQFQSLCTALAATVGTGNIVGVAGAIMVGGPGAVFWMWLIAFFGMMTNYSENVLGIYYRRKNSAGEWSGGAMYYLRDGLGAKPGCKAIGSVLAVLFSIFCFLASFGIGNMTQANSIAAALQQTLHIDPKITGAIIMVIVAVVILGGIKRIAQVTEKLVPVMGVIYVALGVITIVMNAGKLPAAFAVIFQGAFNPSAVAGGVLGYTIMNAIRFGFARGVFSNEAGLGSAPIAHAASSTDNPVKQGMWGAFEVIFDTFIICTITALVVVMSGLWGPEGAGLDGAALSIAAFQNSVGIFGAAGVTIGTVLFALSTLLGWSYYGEKSIEYLFKGSSIVGGVKLGYKIVFILLTFVGSIGGLKLIWDIADTLNGLMAIPNLIALVLLSGTVTKLVKEYFREQKKA